LDGWYDGLFTPPMEVEDGTGLPVALSRPLVGYALLRRRIPAGLGLFAGLGEIGVRRTEGEAVPTVVGVMFTVTVGLGREAAAPLIDGLFIVFFTVLI
jgi:hypothetical protein